jgi:hypothetical protein
VVDTFFGIKGTDHVDLDFGFWIFISLFTFKLYLVAAFGIVFFGVFLLDPSLLANHHFLYNSWGNFRVSLIT